MTRLVPRALLLTAAAGCLLLAGVLAPCAPAGPGDVLGAVGRSMGGVRVMVIDGFFLRAEGLRRTGRIDDAAALYQTVLGLDPDNEAASIFLANVYLDDLMPQVADVEERFGWWQEARALLERALRKRPESPRLHARLAVLILDASFAEPRLAVRIEQEMDRPRLVALRHLRAAVRGAETLPKLGHNHLVRVAGLAPLVAGDALRDGDRAAFEEAVAVAREARALRGSVMDGMPLDDDVEANLGQLLDLGLATVEAAAGAVWAGEGRDSALQLLAAYRAALPHSPLVGVLEEVLSR